MTGIEVPGLVSCQWLSENLANNDNSHLKILATDFSTPGSGLQWFFKGHIPMSQYFDLWKGVEVTQYMLRGLPNPDEFEQYVQSHGISEDTHIIIYDNDAIFYSARLWYQFKLFGHKKVSVLDGGLIHWQQLQLPIEAGDKQLPKKGNFKVQPISDSSLINYEDFIEGKCKDKQILDTRLVEDFEDENTEPSMITKYGFETAGIQVPKKLLQGHIPGSVSMTFADFLNHETYCFLSPEKLLQAFTKIGIDPTKSVIGTCYTGTSVCMYPLALTTLNLKPGSFQLYLGSWSEYGQKATEDVIEKGAVAKH